MLAQRVLIRSASALVCTGFVHHSLCNHRPELRQPARQLQSLLKKGEILVLPCCGDALTAKLVERAGFHATFMSGFSVSATHRMPDTQLLSYKEMVDAAASIASALKNIPCIGDGDTGYGNAVNVKRTIHGYGQAGMACVMIEDQVQPKVVSVNALFQ